MLSFGIGKKILCPFCFNEFSENKVLYRCFSASCKQDASDSVIDKMKSKTGEIPRHIIANPKAKKGICKCDKCGKPTSTKVCPNCTHDLPGNILESPTKIISIVGAKGSGKSYFVGTFLMKVMEDGIFARPPLSAACRWLEKCQDEYENRFKSPIDSRKPLPGTNLVDDLIREYPPLLMEISRKQSGSIKANTFSFFDAAGENFEDPAILTQVGAYLGHSVAIIVILDPWQLPKLEAAFNSVGFKSNHSEKKYSEIIDNTIMIIRNQMGLPKGKINIPLCLCISKWDLVTKVPNLISPDYTIAHQDMSNYDKDFIDTASEELKDFLVNYEPNLINTVEQNFETTKYFAFSAWGFSNEESTGSPVIASYKVEDPILWLFDQKMI